MTNSATFRIGTTCRRASCKTWKAPVTPPSEIDTVMCTHLHVDHVGWNTSLVDGAWVPTFPNARYLVAESEWAHWNDNPDVDE